jgi:hypothetical protein
MQSLQTDFPSQQLIGLASPCGEFSEDLIEYAEPAPADEPVIDRLMWAKLFRCVAPSQSVPDDENNAADDPPVIDPGDTVRKRKTWRNQTPLCGGKPNQYLLNCPGLA